MCSCAGEQGRSPGAHVGRRSYWCWLVCSHQPGTSHKENKGTGFRKKIKRWGAIIPWPAGSSLMDTDSLTQKRPVWKQNRGLCLIDTWVSALCLGLTPQNGCSVCFLKLLCLKKKNGKHTGIRKSVFLLWVIAVADCEVSFRHLKIPREREKYSCVQSVQSSSYF